MRLKKIFLVGAATLVSLMCIRIISFQYFNFIYDYKYKITVNFEEYGRILKYSGVSRASLKRKPICVPHLESCAYLSIQGEAIPIIFSNGKMIFATMRFSNTGPTFQDNGTWPFRTFSREDRYKISSEVAHIPLEISPENMPALVRFQDLNDPFSAEIVPRENISSIAGKNTKFKSMTIEMTNDPIEWRLAGILPWLLSDETERLNPNILEYMYQND